MGQRLASGRLIKPRRVVEHEQAGSQRQPVEGHHREGRPFRTLLHDVDGGHDKQQQAPVEQHLQQGFAPKIVAENADHVSSVWPGSALKPSHPAISP